MSRYILLGLLCSTSAGCAAMKSRCDDYCDHWCEKDPVQAALIRSYKQENHAYLCRPFMPLEVVESTRPYLAPGISNLGALGLASYQFTPLGAIPVPVTYPESSLNLPPAPERRDEETPRGPPKSSPDLPPAPGLGTP